MIALYILLAVWALQVAAFCWSYTRSRRGQQQAQ